MHRPEYYSEQFFVENGRITRLVYAHYKDVKQECYKATDEGRIYFKNYSCWYLQGWLISIPGETWSDNWGGHGIEKDEHWWEYHPGNISCPLDERKGYKKYNKKELLRIVTGIYPGFAYTARKYNFLSTVEIMKALIVWKRYPDVEYVLASGFIRLAYSSGFMRLKKETKKKYIKWMKANPKETDITYNELKTLVNLNITREEYREYKEFCFEAYANVGISYQIYLYFKKIIDDFTPGGPMRYSHREAVIFEYYCDYIRMAKKANHDINDKYWKFPSDLVKAHNKVMRECEAIDRAKRLQAEAEKKKARENAFVELSKIENRFKEYDLVIDGYRIYVSGAYESWVNQATLLHQCILSAGYYEGMKKGRFVIVFISEKDKPIATAQVYPKGEVGQFYGNELDRSNCLPPPKAEVAFNIWLGLVPKEKFKKTCNKEKEGGSLGA